MEVVHRRWERIRGRANRSGLRYVPDAMKPESKLKKQEINGKGNKDRAICRGCNIGTKRPEALCRKIAEAIGTECTFKLFRTTPALDKGVFYISSVFH